MSYASFNSVFSVVQLVTSNKDTIAIIASRRIRVATRVVRQWRIRGTTVVMLLLVIIRHINISGTCVCLAGRNQGDVKLGTRIRCLLIQLISVDAAGSHGDVGANDHLTRAVEGYARFDWVFARHVVVIVMRVEMVTKF